MHEFNPAWAWLTGDLPQLFPLRRACGFSSNSNAVAQGGSVREGQPSHACSPGVVQHAVATLCLPVCDIIHHVSMVQKQMVRRRTWKQNNRRHRLGVAPPSKKIWAQESSFPGGVSRDSRWFPRSCAIFRAWARHTGFPAPFCAHSAQRLCLKHTLISSPATLERSYAHS